MLPTSLKEADIVIATLQMRKLRCREVKKLAQSHMESQWLIQDL